MIELYHTDGSHHNCSNSTIDNVKFLNRMRNITAIPCSVITLAILIFLIFSKAFSSPLKRLCFFLTVGTLFAEIVIGLNIEQLWDDKEQQTACVWLGYFAQWICVVVFILTYEIVLHLLYLVLSKLKKSQPSPQRTRSKCCTLTVEIVCIILPVIIATILAVMQKGYGIAGPWCLIQPVNGQCKPSGLVIQTVVFSLYIAVDVVGISASFVLFIIYFKISYSVKDARSLLKQIFYVMLFQIIHILILTYNISVRVYTLSSQRQQLLELLYGFWVVDVFTIPIGIVIFPFGYLILTFYPVKQSVVNILKKIAGKCCKYKKSSQHSQHQSDMHQSYSIATAPESDRVSQPSYTFFDVPHPDESLEQSRLIGDVGCKQKYVN